MLIRSGIFLVAGLATIFFKKQLNNWKNHILKSIHLKSWIKDERKGYIYTGTLFIIISIMLFIYSILN
jgi:hypothetical protein